MDRRGAAEKQQRIESIQQLVADRFCMGVEELKGPSRQKHMVMPRQIAMYLAYRSTGASLAQIGSTFGRRHGTTVSHSIAMIEQHWLTVSEVKKVVDDLFRAIGHSIV